MDRYCFAGLQVDMKATGRTRKQALPYAVTAEGPADMTLHCNVQRLMEQNPAVTDPDGAEYMGTGTLFARELLRFDGFQLHSSAIELEGRAYLFSAPSGTGKSTHTEKWCRLFGARLLNDDKPALRLQSEGWIAYGTPWSGKYDLSRPVGVPLGAIAFLMRGQENTIRRLSPEEAIPLLVSQSLRYLNADQMGQQLMLLDRLLQTVPVWELYCRNEDEAAYLSHAHMRVQP